MIVAVTGNTGAGKTIVAGLFAEWGAETIDADSIGRDVWQSDRAIQRQIAVTLGEEVLGANGGVNRRSLGRVVFSDLAKLEAFDRIVQPALRARIASILKEARASAGKIHVLDAALLFEWGLEKRVDLVVAVVADPSVRAERIARRDGRPPNEAVDRVKSQTDEAAGAARADVIIENNGTRNDLERKARQVWNDLIRKEEKGHA